MGRAVIGQTHVLIPTEEEGDQKVVRGVHPAEEVEEGEEEGMMVSFFIPDDHQADRQNATNATRRVIGLVLVLTKKAAAVVVVVVRVEVGGGVGVEEEVEGRAEGEEEVVEVGRQEVCPTISFSD